MKNIRNKTLIVDFDNTIVDSITAVVNCYNEDYRYYPDYKPIHPCQVETYNFKELSCADKEYLKHIWNRPRLFEKIGFMDNAEEVLDILKDDYYIEVSSFGLPPNLKLKKEWIERHLPYVEKFYGIDIRKYSDKSHIDMRGCVFLDDQKSNLVTSNAKTKILFGDDQEWNRNWTGLHCYNWYEVLAQLELD